MTDIIAAVRQHLLDNAEVGALCGDRIYAAELPRSETENMPRKAAVLRYAGGLERAWNVPLADPRIDVWSYGETYHEAGLLDRAIYQSLKDMDRETTAGVLLHGVALSGGPLQVRDEQTGWPIQWRSIVVSADERDVS